MSSPPLIYQDYFPTLGWSSSDKESLDTADKFFELANSPLVCYSIDSTPEKLIKVRQTSNCETHTGGIVWETAYLLANYLLITHKEKTSLGRLLEVGSGCGLLGLILAANERCSKVVMTETTEVIDSLRQNVEMNISPLNGSCQRESIAVQRLRWDQYENDIIYCQKSCHDLDPHSFDTVIGTDVIFSERLVKPLLKTIRKMVHEKSHIYICVQIRCADAHDLFLKKASKYGFKTQDCTNELEGFPALKWGIEMECKLFHITLNSQGNLKRKRSQGKNHLKQVKLKTIKNRYSI